MVRSMFEQCKRILEEEGIEEYVIKNLNVLDEINLVGESVQEILEISKTILEGLTEETIYVIRYRQNRMILEKFRKKYSYLFNNKPYKYEFVRFLEEFLCGKVFQLKEEECAQALEYIQYFVSGKEDYDCYRHYLFMRSVLIEDGIQLPITIREYDDYITTYEVAEQYMISLQEEGRKKIYEIS